MSSQTLTAKTLTFRPLNNSAMAERHDAEAAYIDHARGFDGEPVGAGTDLAFLDGHAMQVIRLAKNAAALPEHTRFIDARPDWRTIAEQLCDVIEGALGPHAGRVVRAYVRGEG